MLATLVDKPFDGKDWIFEIKWDGYRALARKKKQVSLISRGQKSFNRQFPLIVEEVKKIPGNFLLDGEIVVLDKKGLPHFQLMQNYQKTKQGPLYYYVFDILSIQGKDITGLPLIERKKILKKLLAQAKLKHVRFSDHIEEKGKAFFAQAANKGLEGIMAKKKDSTYQFRRSRDWLKIKTSLRQEVVIGGFTAPRGSRKKFGALLVGVYDKGNLTYTGHIGGGFDEKLLNDVYEKLKKVISKTCPFLHEPHPNAHVTWVKPKLVCEVSFSEWTSEGIMRQPIFKGLRIDKSAKEVVKEKPGKR